jgi:hypothetical protein
VENAAKNIFIAGLRNAHSMEIQARELMERQSESLEDYPDGHILTIKHDSTVKRAGPNALIRVRSVSIRHA